MRQRGLDAPDALAASAFRARVQPLTGGPPGFRLIGPSWEGTMQPDVCSSLSWPR